MDALAVSTKQELEKIMARGREMEEEAQKLRQAEVEDEELLPDPTMEKKIEVDGRSIFVNNVHYNATAYHLVKHFQKCGTVNRVSILCNKYNGHPKGYAFIEFAEKEAAKAALALAGSNFYGRVLLVMMKRTKQPYKPPSPPPSRNHIVIGRGRGNHRFQDLYGYGTRHS